MKNKYSEIPIASVVDFDQTLNLEKNSFVKSFFNIFFIPFLNSLPKNFKHVIKKTNKAAGAVIDNTASHTALEVLYSGGELFSLKRIRDNFFKYVWFNINNSKAVRNRLKFVKRELKEYLRNVSMSDREIKIISIASGSSRAIIETVRDGNYLQDTKLSITFLDKNAEAIQYSKNLSTHINHLPIKVNWIHDSVGNFLKNPTDEKYDIVEVVGLFDYFEDEKILKILVGIYKILQSGGILITSNVNHNKEEKFITKIINWPMVYRRAEELAKLANTAGFSYNKMKVFYEPLKIHGIVVAEK